MTLGQTNKHVVGPTPGSVLKNLLARSVVAIIIAFTYGLLLTWIALDVVAGFGLSFREVFGIAVVLSFVHTRFTASVK